MPTSRFRAEVDEDIIRIEGDIDVFTAADLEACFQLVGQSAVIVDLTNVTFVDAHGLGVVLSAADRLAAVGQRLTVRGASGSVRTVFQSAGCDGLLVD